MLKLNVLIKVLLLKNVYAQNVSLGMIKRLNNILKNQ